MDELDLMDEVDGVVYFATTFEIKAARSRGRLRSIIILFFCGLPRCATRE